jgi:hypothetical protein
MRLIDTGGGARLKNLLAHLRQETPKLLETTAHIIAAEAAARAPSPQDEYDIMMLGDGNPEGITNVPSMPSSSSGSDGDHRLRFFKPSKDYLRPTIMQSVIPQGMQVGIGSIAQLEHASIYIWRNIDNVEHTASFPFWEAWELGLNNTFEIKPRNFSANSKRPTLKPGLGPENKRLLMTKNRPRLGMYTLVDKQKYKDILLPALRKIAREA